MQGFLRRYVLLRGAWLFLHADPCPGYQGPLYPSISYEDKHILSILLNFVVRYPHIPLTRVYIDFLTPVNDYMNLKQYLATNHMPYLFENPVYNYETLKERAEELWKGGKIDIMLTRTTNQLNVLNKLKIPYIHILPTEEMIRDSIKSAVNAIRLKRQSRTQSSSSW